MRPCNSEWRSGTKQGGKLMQELMPLRQAVKEVEAELGLKVGVFPREKNSVPTQANSIMQAFDVCRTFEGTCSGAQKPLLLQSFLGDLRMSELTLTIHQCKENI